jgi:hypothetical protein
MSMPDKILLRHSISRRIRRPSRYSGRTTGLRQHYGFARRCKTWMPRVSKNKVEKGIDSKNKLNKLPTKRKHEKKNIFQMDL